MRRGRTEKHSVGNDAGAASAHFEHTNEKREKKELSLFCFAHFQKIGRDDIGIQTPFEWGICKNESVFFAVGILVGKTVAVFNERIFNTVRHHVHRADTKHRAVHVVAVEHIVHVVILVLAVEKDLLLAVFLKIVTHSNKKSRSAARRIADDLVSFRLHQVDHHADNVARSAELTVDTRSRNLGKQIFVNIAARICRLELGHLLVNAVHRSHDLVEHQRSRDLENRITHIFGIGAFLVSVQVFDERKDPFLHSGIHLRSRKIVKNAPLELTSVHSALADLNITCKNAFVSKPQHRSLFRTGVVGIIQIVNEHQISHLLNDIKRIRETARPENFPKRVDFVFKFACDHVLLLFFLVSFKSPNFHSNLSYFR